MLKAYKYRIYPNKKQIEMLNKHFGCSRFIYNWALQTKNEVYIKHKKSLSRFDLQSKLLQLKSEFSWLKEVNSQSLQSSLLNLDNAFSNFFRRCKEKTNKKGFPTFKTRKGKQSFQCPQYVKVDFERSKISLPKIKDIKTVFSRKFEGKIKTVTISKTCSNKFFVSILVETNEKIPEKPKIDPNKTVGIDLGLKDFAILSTGEKIKNPRFNYAKEQEQIKRLNRKICRQYRMNEKHSNNRNKNCIKRAKLFEKITNRREDFLHKLSTKLIRENQTICLEDLNVSGMMKNHKVAESFSSISLSTFVRMLEYKAEWYGRNIIFIGRFDPSSKICNYCGYYKKDLTLKDRTWVCPDCGTEHDRDINAARNIRDFALQKQNLILQVPMDNRELTLQETKPLLNNRKAIRQVSSMNEESTRISD
jgi:putative transposase